MRYHPWLLAVLMLMLGLALTVCNGNTYDDDTSGDDDAGDDDSSATDDDDDDNVGDDDSAGAEPQIFVDPDMLAFGSVCVGSSGMLPIAIANLGDAPLVIDAMQCPLPEVTFTPYTGQIPPGASPVGVDVTVNCAVQGVLTGPLKIISNDPNRPQYNVGIEVSCDTC